ncbi:hypothetical protein AAG570_003738 [Ranatra chinensis]|uniref:Immunoglobulin I-set domain-containing protein n=1 Tax=Ranatra chinensis TaxID=642074 RepID=A0ABD0YR96_9HEMI
MSSNRQNMFEKMNAIPMKHGLEVQVDPVRLRLTLRGLAHRDFGYYTCVANNSMGSANASARLYGEFSKVLRPIRDRVFEPKLATALWQDSQQVSAPGKNSESSFPARLVALGPLPPRCTAIVIANIFQ